MSGPSKKNQVSRISRVATFALLTASVSGLALATPSRATVYAERHTRIRGPLHASPAPATGFTDSNLGTRLGEVLSGSVRRIQPRAHTFVRDDRGLGLPNDSSGGRTDEARMSPSDRTRFRLRAAYQVVRGDRGLGLSRGESSGRFDDSRAAGFDLGLTKEAQSARFDEALRDAAGSSPSVSSMLRPARVQAGGPWVSVSMNDEGGAQAAAGFSLRFR